MTYRVCKIYGSGREQLSGTFKTRNEADAYIDEHLPKEALLGAVTYRIYDFDDLVAERKSTEESSTHTTESQAGAGRGAAPTPFRSAPTPANTPHTWMKDEDIDKK
jgi:hypothetical protein